MAKKTILSFQNFTDDESARYLANHYPKGRLTSKRFTKGTVLHQYIRSLSIIIKTIIGDLFVLVKNRDIQKADELLEYWETSVGIPDQLQRRDSIAGRRDAVQCLISKIPVYNIENGVVDEKTTFEYYVKCLTGLNIEIRTAKISNGKGSDFPQEFPITFGYTSALGNLIFLIGVEVQGAPANNFFPLPFPVQFFDPKIPDATIERLDAVLERVIPACSYWIYEPIVV